MTTTLTYYEQGYQDQLEKLGFSFNPVRKLVYNASEGAKNLYWGSPLATKIHKNPAQFWDEAVKGGPTPMPMNRKATILQNKGNYLANRMESKGKFTRPIPALADYNAHNNLLQDVISESIKHRQMNPTGVKSFNPQKSTISSVPFSWNKQPSAFGPTRLSNPHEMQTVIPPNYNAMAS